MLLYLIVYHLYGCFSCLRGLFQQVQDSVYNLAFKLSFIVVFFWINFHEFFIFGFLGTQITTKFGSMVCILSVFVGRTRSCMVWLDGLQFNQCFSGAQLPVWFGLDGLYLTSACQFLDLFFYFFLYILIFFFYILNFFSMSFVLLLIYSIYKSCPYVPNTLITLIISICFATLLKSHFGMSVLL